MKIVGTFGEAVVMIDAIDETTDAQIQSILDHPISIDANIRIMPDCHAGSGCVIGYTQIINGYIVPNLVGVDIGCGVIAAKLGKISIDFKEFDCYVKQHIPLGFAHRTRSESKNVAQYIENADHIQNFHPIIEMLALDVEQVLSQIGTLGGGNHFCELGMDEMSNVWAFIHSGSRNFGLRVAKYFQKRAKEIGNAVKDSVVIPIDTDYLVSDDWEYMEYLQAMDVGCEFAQINRFAMMNLIVNFFGLKLDEIDVIESVHNYINRYDMIVRKGAISAHNGEKCLIPFNWIDGIAICTGLGNSDYNFSAPHGAGRVMSRKKANSIVKIEKLSELLLSNNIYSTTTQFALDEAPEVYKSVESIAKFIQPTATIDHLVKPIYSLKSIDTPKYMKCTQ